MTTIVRDQVAIAQGTGNEARAIHRSGMRETEAVAEIGTESGVAESVRTKTGGVSRAVETIIGTLTVGKTTRREAGVDLGHRGG